MEFVRGGPDPIRFVIFVVCVVFALIWKAIKKTLSAEASPPQSSKSFRFSEMSAGPADTHIRIIQTKILGVSHRNPDGTSRQQIIRNFCHAGDALFLIREPDNPADANAIQVIRICRGADGKADFRERLGYLSKEIALDLAPIFPDGPVGLAEILEITGDLEGLNGDNVGVNIRAEVYLPDTGAVGSTPASAAQVHFYEMG